MREFRINSLGDHPIRIDEIVWLLEIKSWIGAKKFRELVKAPVKSGGPNDLLHLSTDTFHFREADLVNLLRRQIRRRLPADVKGISRSTVRQRADGDVFAACGNVG